MSMTALVQLEEGFLREAVVVIRFKFQQIKNGQWQWQLFGEVQCWKSKSKNRKRYCALYHRDVVTVYILDVFLYILVYFGIKHCAMSPSKIIPLKWDQDPGSRWEL